MRQKDDELLLSAVSGGSPNLLKVAETVANTGMQVLRTAGRNGLLHFLTTDSIILASDDYQVVKNLHVTLVHWFVKELS